MGPVSRSRSLSSGARSRDPLAPLYGTTGVFADSVFKQPKAFPRQVFARVATSHCPLSDRGRRESRAPTAPAAPCAMVVKNAHGFDRYSRDIPAFPAQWSYGLYVLSPVSGLCCHRCRTCHRAGRIDARVAAPGPHDFAVRCERFRLASKARLTPQRPSPPAPTCRDDHDTPLRRHGMGGG